MLPVVSPAVEALGWLSYRLVGGSILGGSEETNSRGACGTEAGRGLAFIKKKLSQTEGGFYPEKQLWGGPGLDTSCCVSVA